MQFLFLLTESSSLPLERQGETVTPSEGASSSGSYESKIPAAGKKPGVSIPDNLFYKDGDRFERLDAYSLARVPGCTYGRIVDGFVRPIYNDKHKMVIVDDEDFTVFEIDDEEANRRGINQPVPKTKPTKPPLPPNRPQYQPIVETPRARLRHRRRSHGRS